MELTSTNQKAALVWLGVGCNISPLRWRWNKLNIMLNSMRGIHVREWSSTIATTASGPGVTGQFWNAVVLIESRLSPFVLLNKLKLAERHLGRTGAGNRPADFDILWWKDPHGWRTLESTRLRIPHPQANRRPFVLAPLSTMFSNVPSPVYRVLEHWKKCVSSPFIQIIDRTSCAA